MAVTKSYLLGKLREVITPAEWTDIVSNRKLTISEFNRSVLIELKDADLTDGNDFLEEKEISGLHLNIKTYLEKELKDKPDGWKWIIIASIYLTFVAERPMHPIDMLGIKVSEIDGITVYECPVKSENRNTACYYCVCKRMSNYEIMKQQMQKEFLKYDQEKMIKKFQLQHDSDYIFMEFVGRKYRIQRKDGKIRWSEDAFATSQEAGYNETMTIYDILCFSKEGCCPEGEFVNMRSLSTIQGGSVVVGNSLFNETEKQFDHRDTALACACERLNGVKAGKGDVAYQIPVFDFLPVILQFWNSDEDFPASLQLFVDKNILHYMHYETVWFAMSHLLGRIKEEMKHFT